MIHWDWAALTFAAVVVYLLVRIVNALNATNRTLDQIHHQLSETDVLMDRIAKDTARATDNLA